jgi:hypothetical protein
MYQPYPAGTQLPEVQRPPIPPQVANAVKVMYVGAAASILGIAFIVGGVIAAAVWIVLARACRNGQSWARTTGTVLFALATVDTIVGLSAPIAGPVRLWGLVTWLAGLVAVILLWQRPSTAYFKGIIGA